MNELLNHEKRIVDDLYWPFFGCFMQQTPNAVLSLNRLINAYNFTNIIELGTHDGGLSMLFAMYCMSSRIPSVSDDPNEPSLYKNRTHHKQPKTFYTFDKFIRDKNRIDMMLSMGAVFKQLDFLQDQEAIDYIRSVISKSGKTLVLCDGGDKCLEFSLYSPALKSGDIIMVHDWARDEIAYAENMKNRIWKGWESRWEDGELQTEKTGLRKTCEQNDITQIHAEEFDNSVWFCGQKQ